MRDQTDSQLLDQFRTRECEKAFESLVERYMPMVHGVCSRVLNSHAEAEDASQAVFVALALKAEGLNAEKGLAAWLHRVAHSVSVDIVRKNQRRDARELAACSIEAVSRDVPRSDEQLERLDAAVMALPKPLREAVIRHYLLGWPVLQIAEADGVSPSAVTMRLTRARERLRKALAIGSSSAIVVLLALAHPSNATAAALPAAAAVMQSVRSALLGTQTASGPVALAVAIAQDLLRRWAIRRTTMNVATVVLLSLILGALIALLLPGSAVAHSAAEVKTQTKANAVPSAGSSRDNADSSAAVAVEEHPLIRAAKTRYEWKDLTEFTKILDRAPSPIDDIRDQSGRTALHWASLSCGHETHFLLMLRGASVNARDASGKTPLTYAVETGHDWMLLQYLLAGADPNVVAADQTTPLSWAALNDKPRMCEILLWMGADPNPPGLTGAGAPLEAARKGGSQKVRDVFNRYVGLNGQPSKRESKEAPLFVKETFFKAASRGDFDTLDSLLDRGMSIDTRDEKGRTALHRAISGGQGDVVFYLLLLGADPNAVDLKGVSPMMVTMSWVGGQYDASRRFLIWKGANVHYIRPDQHSELTYSAVRDNDHGMQWLIWAGAKPWQGSVKHGTSYQIAYNEGNQRLLDLLQRNGVTERVPEIHDTQERFHHAAKRGDINAMEEALSAGAELDKAYAPTGDSALMQTILKRNVLAAKYLISRGARVDFVNPKNGDTPLCSTLIWNSGEMTELRQLLLSKGADPSVKSNNGTPAIMRVLSPSPGDPLKQLLDAGADINARDAKGRTTMGVALEDGHYETAEYLKSLGGTL